MQYYMYATVVVTALIDYNINTGMETDQELVNNNNSMALMNHACMLQKTLHKM